MRGGTRGSSNPGIGKGKGKDQNKIKSPSPSKTRTKSDEEDDASDDCSKENPPPCKKKRSTSTAFPAASSSPPEAVAESDVKGQNIVITHSKYIRVTAFMLHLCGNTMFHVTISCYYFVFHIHVTASC